MLSRPFFVVAQGLQFREASWRLGLIRLIGLLQVFASQAVVPPLDGWC